jgi:cell division protein FtsB
MRRKRSERGEKKFFVLAFSCYLGRAMTARVEELAEQIASLEESDLQALLERVEELSFRRGINALSDQYRNRLERQRKLNEGAETILLKLKQIRQEIASREYPG